MLNLHNWGSCNKRSCPIRIRISRYTFLMLFILTYSQYPMHISVCGCGRKKSHQSGSLLPPTSKQSLGFVKLIVSACVVAPISWEKLYIPLKTRFGLSIDLHICNVKKVKYNTIFDQVLLACIGISSFTASTTDQISVLMLVHLAITSSVHG